MTVQHGHQAIIKSPVLETPDRQQWWDHGGYKMIMMRVVVTAPSASMVRLMSVPFSSHGIMETDSIDRETLDVMSLSS